MRAGLWINVLLKGSYGNIVPQGILAMWQVIPFFRKLSLSVVKSTPVSRSNVITANPISCSWVDLASGAVLY